MSLIIYDLDRLIEIRRSDWNIMHDFLICHNRFSIFTIQPITFSIAKFELYINNIIIERFSKPNMCVAYAYKKTASLCKQHNYRSAWNLTLSPFLNKMVHHHQYLEYKIRIFFIEFPLLFESSQKIPILCQQLIFRSKHIQNENLASFMEVLKIFVAY